MTHHMKRNPFVGSLLVAVMTIAAPPALAQRGPRDPHLAYAYPAGCQRGSSCEVVLGGQYLKDATLAHLSGDGVEVEVLGWYRPLTQGEYNNLRMTLREAKETLIEERKKSQTRGQPSDADVAAAAGLNEEQLREMKIYEERDRDPKRQPNEQLTEQVTLRVKVARDAEPGKRELRLLTETSMSNPLWIQVGRWPEVYETEPNDTLADEAIDELPVVVNGQIMPGDTDTFSFAARQGQRLVIEAGARDVIPFLADAVPGWFQAVMILKDSHGREVAYADSFHYRQDPVIYVEVPGDDRYTVSIRDTLYRGREDFVYRITIGELPFVTSIFPLGMSTDAEATVELDGWNLSQHTIDVKTTSRRTFRPIKWLSVPQDDDLTIRFPLQVDLLPNVFDQEPNNNRDESQELTTRTIVNGRIDSPGDVDVFRIEGRGRIVVEVDARRHGSPLDSMLTLTDAEGNELAFNDDYVDKSQALSTHHADSHLAAVLPGTGPCYLSLTDTQQKGGKDFVYRLYLRAPEPDYELRVVPSSIIARPGAVVPISVFALRQDDFHEDIVLSLTDAPSGFQLSGATVPGSADHVTMTLTIPPESSKGRFVLEMEGKARRHTGGQALLTRPAVPAENMMQAFIWHHLVPVEEWNVIISGKQGPRPPFEVVTTSGDIRLLPGKEFSLPVRLRTKDIVPNELHVELVDSPPGVSSEVVSDEMGRLAIRLIANAGDVERGWRGNLLLRAYRETMPQATKDDPDPQPRRTDYGVLPALPIEIVGRRSGA